ncbi:MAG TPA: hypothetical protein VJR29_06010 [bacterium]|nr:hypothetical protein [bacterium]
MKSDATKTLETALSSNWMVGMLDGLSIRKEAQALQVSLRSDAGEHRVAQHLQSSHAKTALSKLDQLCAAKAPKGTLREGDALKQEQEIEKAKLQQAQLGDSKKLYAKQEAEKKVFHAHQAEVKAKFLAKKPKADQIATFNKVQAADKKAFEAGQVKENVALYNTHKAQTKDQVAWHAKQTKALEAKNQATAKPAAKPVGKPAAKPVAKAAVSEIPTKSYSTTFSHQGKTVIEEGYSKPLSGSAAGIPV